MTRIMLNRRLVAIEIALIVLAALIATRQYLSPDSELVQGGGEAEWLTSSAFMAATGVREQGRIPLWQPYLNRGEPALERPFSFVLNPLSIGPSLIFGAEVGVRYSVVLYAILAGVGGWAAAWVTGLSSPTRLFLAFLMIGLGNMPALTASGYFQLGVAQAFFPWLIAGSIAIARFRHSRAPVVLVAIALTLMFFGGFAYFVFPAVIIVTALAAAFSIRRSSGRFAVDSGLLVRYVIAILLPIPLAAILLHPVISHQNYDGFVVGEDPNNVYVNPLTVLTQFFSTNRTFFGIDWNKNYDLTVVPLIFAILLFVVLPLAIRRFRRMPLPGIGVRVIVVSVALSLFFLLWGTGTNPIMRWANETIPLFSRWQFLSRLLTVVSLFLSLIVALQFDSIWRAVMLDRRGKQIGGLPRFIAGSALIIVMFLAVGDGISKYNRNIEIRQEDANTVQCLKTLRAQQPDDEISLIAEDYYTITPYLRNRVRFTFFTADYHPLGLDPTLFPYDLRQNIARYFIFGDDGDHAYWAERGYAPVPNNPIPGTDVPCLMEYANPLPYAFAISRDELVNYTPPENAVESVQTRYLRPEDVIDLPNYAHLTDAIALTVVALPDEETVITVQELSWPGWVVTVDGQPAQLESIGYMIGVVLPADGASHDILFRYEAPLLRQGAVITLVTIAIVSLWLLRVDRLILRRTPSPQIAETWGAEEIEETETESAEPAAAQKFQLPVWLVEAFRPREVEAPAEESVLPFIDQEPEPTPTSADSMSAEVIPFDD